jgi:hypothetical protein
MRKAFYFTFLLMIIAFSGIHAQSPLFIGMGTEEFKTVKPGLLPDKNDYCADLYLQERIYSVSGRWSFSIKNNILYKAVFNGEDRIDTEAEFKKWVESAKLLIDDYTKLYGKPDSIIAGTNKYLDRKNFQYSKTIGKREIFHEAIWKTKTMVIKISCDFRSNYYEEFQEGIINGPNEWFEYFFGISFSPMDQTANTKPESKGRFYTGMDINDFAKVFPELFPAGIKLTGQWGKDEDYYGLSGSWTYRFKDGKLDWMHFQKYIDEINETNFTKCLTSAKQMISDYTKLYGKPDTTINGNSKFIDPLKSHHWGYDVIEARWKNYNGMKIKVEFSFLGGKGDYHFMVVVNYFDKDYPYYD